MVILKIKVSDRILIHPMNAYYCFGGNHLELPHFTYTAKENWKEDCNSNNALNLPLLARRQRTLTPHWICWFNNAKANRLANSSIQSFPTKITSFHPLAQTLP